MIFEGCVGRLWGCEFSSCAHHCSLPGLAGWSPVVPSTETGSLLACCVMVAYSGHGCNFTSFSHATVAGMIDDI